MSDSTRAGIASATRYVLPNGMVALIHRNPSTPTVSVLGEVLAGAVHEPAPRSGVAALTAAALIRGAGERSFQQIVAETEARGCSVNAGGGLHVSSFGGKALVEDLPLVLDILADMLARPTFPANEVEKLRGQFLIGLRESEQETGARAMRAVRELLYPAEHPYSRLSSGTLETVQAIGRDDLAAFHAGYSPEGATIAVVGDVEPAAVIEALEARFGPWAPGPAPRLELPPVPPLAEVRRREIAMSGKVQADLVWAVHGLARTDPDYYAAMMANLILGRLGMGGRLGENVRENQGMAYYCYSGLEADLGAGPWLAVAGVSPDNVERAVEAVLHEVRRFAAEGPTAQELADARDFRTGSIVLGLETNDGIAGTLLAIERFGLGLDFIARYPALIGAISAEQIVAAARRYLSTDAYALAVAGPPAGGAGLAGGGR
ncbi:MAG TPA: pitrilysin family protein [Chloroflexaceae bacterium]|nr:pitrilysin family protein [Chloroflexaceae bacterium]